MEDMHFCFRLGPDCCALLAGKKCPILTRNKEDNVYGRGDERNGCLGLEARLKESGWNDPEKDEYLISPHPCGRYTISKGQHRLCIMQRIGMNIPNAYKVECKSSPCQYFIQHECNVSEIKTDKNLYFSDRGLLVVDEDGKEIYRKEDKNTAQLYPPGESENPICQNFSRLKGKWLK